MNALRKIKPGHAALCVVLVGLAVALVLAGSGSWLLPVLLLGCLLVMGLMMWAMGGHGHRGG